MPEPTCRIEYLLVQLLNAPLEQRTEHFEFDPHPGCTISGRSERHAGPVRQMFARRVAVQDLQKEYLDGDKRIERYSWYDGTSPRAFPTVLLHSAELLRIP